MAVQMRTILDVADNSGARKLQVILPLGAGAGRGSSCRQVSSTKNKESLLWQCR